MKKKPLSHSPLVRSDTAVYHGAATASVATVIIASREVQIVSQTAGNAAATSFRAGVVVVVAALLASRRCTARHQVHGSTTASGPTKPIGPVQTTARPSNPPTTPARRHESRGRAAFSSGLPASTTSAKSTVAQVVRQVRIASGVAACDSMPTRRQPT